MRALDLLWRNERTEQFWLDHAGICFGDPTGIFGGDEPAAPDYTPMANATTQAAMISDALGREQIAEAKRQFDTNMEVSKPIIQKQGTLMDQAISQGNDYYQYMVSKQRPVEDALNAEAMTGQQDAATKIAMQEAADKAIADSRSGTTQQMNQLVRQGVRYGFSPERMASMGTAAALAGAQQQVAGSNAARTQAKSEAWAKKMDVAGLYRGLAGASQGAYSVANQSGNSAVQNQLAPSNSYMSQVAQGTGTVLSGQQMKLQGEGNILNAKTNFATAQFGGASPMAGIGSLMGGAAAMYSSGMFSDRRLKENIEQVGVDERTGLKLYEFNYIGLDDRRYRGVMADEVEPLFPDAVAYDDLGFASVDYGQIGIDMVRVS